MGLDKLLRSTKSRSQIAKEYGITAKTLRTRLKKRGVELPAGVLFPDTQRLIYDTLGWPPLPEITDNYLVCPYCKMDISHTLATEFR